MRQGLQWWARRWLGVGHGPLSWIVRLTLGLATLVVLVGAFIAWRMEQAPVSLGFAIPAIEAALAPSDGALRVSLGEFRLRRDGLRFTFEAIDMAVFEIAPPDGSEAATTTETPFATLPLARLDLSLAALMQHGVLAPQRITARGLVVTAERGPDGIELTVAEGDADSDDGISLAALRHLLRQDERLRHLQTVELSDLTFRVNDPVLGIAWQTENTSMTLANDAGGLVWKGRSSLEAQTGDLDKAIEEGGLIQWTVSMPVEDRIDAGTGAVPALETVESPTALVDRARLRIQLFELQPGLIIDLMPRLQQLVNWQGAVSGTVDTEFPLQGLPNNVTVALRMQAGELRLPMTGGKLPFHSAQAAGSLRLNERALVLDELNIAHDAGVARLRGQGVAHESGSARLQLQASGLHLAWLSNLLPDVDQLAGADLSIAADIDATVLDNGLIGPSTIRAETDTGRIALEGFLPEPLRVGRSALELTVEDDGRRFVLQNARIALPDPNGKEAIAVDVSGEATLGGEGVLRIETGGLDEVDLKRLWPIGLGEGARRWINKQVRKGSVPEALIDVDFRMPDASALKLPDDIRIDGRLKLQDVTLVYWSPLPPATGMSADARITEKLFEADVTGGSSGGMQVNGGRLVITGIDKGKGHEFADMAFDVSGSVSDLMAILDRPPLGFAGYFNLAPNQLAGTIRGTLKTAFAPAAGLTLDDFTISASAMTRGASLPMAAFDQELTDGDLTIDVDKAGLKLSGNARMVGAPVQLQGDMRFNNRAPFGSRFRLQGTVDDSARRALGFSAFPFSAETVSGPVAIDLTATDERRSGTLVEINADLSRARLALPILNWHSEPGGFAAANARIRIVGGQVRRVDSFRLTAPQLNIAGNVDWRSGASGLPLVSVSELRHGAGTDLTLVATPAAADEYRVKVVGRRLDASGMLRRLNDASPQAGGDNGEDTRLTLDLNLAELRLGNGPPLQQVSGSLSLAGSRLQAAKVGGKTLGGGAVAVEIGPQGRASLRAGDAGALLVALGVTGRLHGGALEIDAAVPPGAGAVKGSLNLRGGVLREAPFLMRLLSGGSLSPPPIAESWALDRLQTDFVSNRGVLSFEDGLVSGGELGATFRGWIDTNRDRLDISGAIVPAYSVNRVLRAIPLLGDLLTGGEGLFAANYRATGAIAQPDFNVNPLTALAPGLVRKLFQNGASQAPAGPQ